MISYYALLALLVAGAHTDLLDAILPSSTGSLEDVFLRFYNGDTTDEYVDVHLFNCTDLLQVEGFNSLRPSMVYAHGFNESVNKNSTMTVIGATLQLPLPINVAAIDWSSLANGSYLTAAPNTEKVGLALAKHCGPVLGTKAKLLHLVGHSLGAQLVGYAGRGFQDKYNTTIYRITGLDPAGPLYNLNIPLKPLTKSDADFVDIIDTNMGGYGEVFSDGTANFYPNGGIAPQPGCPVFAPIPLSNDSLCSHRRSWAYWAESLLRPEAFPASPADSYLQFLASTAPEQGFVYMGYYDTSARGKYYFHTNAESPYGKGIAGLYSNGNNSTN